MAVDRAPCIDTRESVDSYERIFDLEASTSRRTHKEIPSVLLIFVGLKLGLKAREPAVRLCRVADAAASLFEPNAPLKPRPFANQCFLPCFARQPPIEVG